MQHSVSLDASSIRCLHGRRCHSFAFENNTPSSHPIRPIRHTVLYEINTLVYVFPVTIVTMLLQCCNNAVTRACACDFRRQASVASDTYITTHVHIRHTYTYVYTLLLQNTMSCKYTWRILNPVQALPIGSL
jgi:hypothetical protein